MPDAEEKDKVQFRQYIDNRIDEIVAKHLEQLGRELDARIDGVGDLLSQRLAAVELPTLEIKSDGTAPIALDRLERNLAAEKKIRWQTVNDIEAGLESLDRRLAALEAHRTPAHRELAQENLRLWGEMDNHKRAINGLRQWLALSPEASPELVAERVKQKVTDASRALDELAAENRRLQKELDELLGTEFFKTGERLRHGAAGVFASDLRNLLLDERVDFWLHLLIRRSFIQFDDAATQTACRGLQVWSSAIKDWCAAHLPGSTSTIRDGDAVSLTDSGDLKRADIYEQFGRERLFDNNGNFIGKGQHLNPTSNEE